MLLKMPSVRVYNFEVLFSFFYFHYFIFIMGSCFDSFLTSAQTLRVQLWTVAALELKSLRNSNRFFFRFQTLSLILILKSNRQQ